MLSRLEISEGEGALASSCKDPADVIANQRKKTKKTIKLSVL